MKKMFTFLAIFATINCQAQLSTEFATVAEIKDTILHALPNGFSYSKMDSIYELDEKIISLHFTNAKKEVEIMFVRKKNNVLSFREIGGDFTPVFELWKKYFDANADAGKLEKDGHANIGTRKIVNTDDTWIID